jgi:hypothetical protein
VGEHPGGLVKREDSPFVGIPLLPEFGLAGWAPATFRPQAVTFTFIVEACDDVVYSVVDLEDGIKKGVLTCP